MKLLCAAETTVDDQLVICTRKPHAMSHTGFPGYHQGHLELDGRPAIARWFGRVVHIYSIRVERTTTTQTGTAA